MGKIGFRIRSSREGQVPVYVYAYWPARRADSLSKGIYKFTKPKNRRNV